MDAADRAQEEQDAELANFLEAQRGRAALEAQGSRNCSDCGFEIPAARRRAMPSAIRCVDCQAWVERLAKVPA